MLGLILGAVPIYLPGVDTKVCLGVAGGPIIVGLLVGAFGPRFHLVTYTTRSANLMLRGIGLSLFLACLGLSSGADFLETVMSGDGPLWILLGFIITVVPVIVMAVLSMRLWKLSFGESCMANPMALNFSNDTCNSDDPAVAYATVYPVSMFVRVIVAQLLVVLFY